MGPWLIPAIMGAFSTVGQLITNRSQEKQAQKQMDFQERLSNTATQRSAKDALAAGFNPVMALNHQASSPAGAQAQIGNAIEKGTSNATAFRQLTQSLKFAEQQNKADLENKASSTALNRALGGKALMDASVSEAERALKAQQLTFQAALQPHTLRLQGAEALLRELSIPGAQNKSELNTLGGKLLDMLTPGVNAGLGAAKHIHDMKLLQQAITKTRNFEPFSAYRNRK